MRVAGVNADETSLNIQTKLLGGSTTQGKLDEVQQHGSINSYTEPTRKCTSDYTGLIFTCS